ncbi:hypothetical protein [Streptomyces sp. NPDC051677]|uniref:hypothetical protein n=1 Tax=Streptomyces sp. NPDC051677 TaxID=3365669 RepID=UPI0037D8E4DD
MGYELRRTLREALGPEISGLQRAVALEIADDANDATRLSYAPLEDLRRWTAAKDTTVVRNALKRLAAAGWEFRVPIDKKGKDGRILYAVPGRRMTFRVPEVEGVAPATPSKEEPPLPHQGGAPATPRDPEGVAPAHSGVAPAPSGVAPATPFSSSPQTSSSPRARAERLLRDLGATEDETTKILAKIEASGSIRNLAAYLKRMEAQGDLTRLIAEERSASDRRQAAARQSVAMAGGEHAFEDDGCGTGTCRCERPHRHRVHGGT